MKIVAAKEIEKLAKEDVKVSKLITELGVVPVLVSMVGVVVGALLTYVKFRPVREARFRPTTTNTTPEDERRAALESLLLGKKKRGSD